MDRNVEKETVVVLGFDIVLMGLDSGVVRVR